MPRWDARGLETLQIRFQKFKWNYIQIYQAAHERWRREGERVAIELADAREHFAALEQAQCDRRAGRCLPASALGDAARRADTRPWAMRGRRRRSRWTLSRAVRDADSCWARRCPVAELGEVFEDVRRALKAKLTALSHDAIARLIVLHDRGHRLDGFLKITQAAHTDALVRVLDDNLARYLGRLLDEVQDRAEEDGAGVIGPFTRGPRRTPRV